MDILLFCFIFLEGVGWDQSFFRSHLCCRFKHELVVTRTSDWHPRKKRVSQVNWSLHNNLTVSMFTQLTKELDFLYLSAKWNKKRGYTREWHVFRRQSYLVLHTRVFGAHRHRKPISLSKGIAKWMVLALHPCHIACWNFYPLIIGLSDWAYLLRVLGNNLYLSRVSVQH